MPRDCGKCWTRVCTWSLALTNQLDFVAVGNAPVTVDLISLLGPIVSNALFSCSFIQKINGYLCAYAKDGCVKDYSNTKCLGIELMRNFHDEWCKCIRYV